MPIRVVLTLISYKFDLSLIVTEEGGASNNKQIINESTRVALASEALVSRPGHNADPEHQAQHRLRADRSFRQSVKLENRVLRRCKQAARPSFALKLRAGAASVTVAKLQGATSGSTPQDRSQEIHTHTHTHTFTTLCRRLFRVNVKHMHTRAGLCANQPRRVAPGRSTAHSRAKIAFVQNKHLTCLPSAGEVCAMCCWRRQARAPCRGLIYPQLAL